MEPVAIDILAFEATIELSNALHNERRPRKSPRGFISATRRDIEDATSPGRTIA